MAIPATARALHPTATKPTSAFLRACLKLPAAKTPVWFMRQAGRYLPEYRRLRQKYSLLELCQQPELAAEVTLQPVRRLGVDAAILFADLLLPVIPLGLGLEFAQGEGPIIHHPIRSAHDVEALPPVHPETDLGYVLEAIRILRGELGVTPLIGFCGAPFTLASYLIEAGASRDFTRTKAFMYQEPRAWHLLMDKLAVMLAGYLKAQIEFGVQVVQVFDSWVGALSPQDYQAFVLPYSQKIFQAVRGLGIPSIHFGTGTATLLTGMKQAGGDVISLDWHIPLDEGWHKLGRDVAVQGNLDPAALLAPLPVLKTRVIDILQRAGGRPGHIFNLGHGVLPSTPLENLQAVVEMVHTYGN